MDTLERKSPAEITYGLNALIDGIVDVASKNGVTLLGVAPRADGTFPESQIEILKRLGDWMKINKTALHGADWHTACEAGTLRFTRKGRYVYAIDLEQPSAPVVIRAVKPEPDSAIRMLGSDKDLAWHQEGSDLVIDELPDPLPCDHAWTFRIRFAAVVNETQRAAAGN